MSMAMAMVKVTRTVVVVVEIVDYARERTVHWWIYCRGRECENNGGRARATELHGHGSHSYGNDAGTREKRVTRLTRLYGHAPTATASIPPFTLLGPTRTSEQPTNKTGKSERKKNLNSFYGLQERRNDSPVCDETEKRVKIEERINWRIKKRGKKKKKIMWLVVDDDRRSSSLLLQLLFQIVDVVAASITSTRICTEKIL